MALQAADIQDLLNSTLKKLDRGHVENLVATYQGYSGDEFMQKHRVKVRGGTSIDFNVVVDTAGNARMTGLYENDSVGKKDGIVTGNEPWRHGTTAAMWEEREFAMNSSSEEQILDLIKLQKDMAMQDWADLVEAQIWAQPTSDSLNIRGVPYWIVYNASEGFNGGNPSNFSSGAGGINSSTYSGWKNYTANYTNVSRDDLIDKMKRGFLKTNWKSPHPFQGEKQTIDRCYYTGTEQIIDLEQLAENQNDNLGFELAPFSNRQMGTKSAPTSKVISFKGCPILHVPYLDAGDDDTGDTLPSNPVYGIDHSTFFFYVLKDEFMRASPAERIPNKHRTIGVWWDTSCQLVCINRRKQQVYATAA